MVHTLVANQTPIMAKSERMEEQYNELKRLIIASRGSVEMGGIPEKELPNKEPSKVILIFISYIQSHYLSIYY